VISSHLYIRCRYCIWLTLTYCIVTEQQEAHTDVKNK
jgi:hypothetical protein